MAWSLPGWSSIPPSAQSRVYISPCSLREPECFLNWLAIAYKFVYILDCLDGCRWQRQHQSYMLSILLYSLYLYQSYLLSQRELGNKRMKWMVGCHMFYSKGLLHTIQEGKDYWWLIYLGLIATCLCSR